MDIRTRNTNTDQNEEEDEEQEDLLTAFDRHLRTVNRLFDERRQKQQLQQEQTSAIAGVAAAAGGISTQLQQLQISGAPPPPPPPPQKQGMRSLLVKAVRQAQVNNVKHMLTDSSPETISAVWEKDGEGGDTLFDEMVKSTSEKHKEIMHLLKAYMAKYPQPQQSLSNPIIILEDE